MAFDTGRYAKEIQKIIAQSSAGPLTEMLNDAAARIGKLIAQGVTPEKAVAAAIGVFPADILKAITPAVFQAACYGYGIMPTMVANPDGVERSLTEKPWTADRMKLSTRLHGTSDAMRLAIIGEVKTALKENNSWREMSKRLYDGYGEKTTINDAKLPDYLSKMEQAARRAFAAGHIDKGAFGEYLALARKTQRQIDSINKSGMTAALKAGYKALLDATQTLAEDRIQKAITIACNERARSYADRIARTETARAWFDGFVASNAEDTDVAGYRWVLGTRHPSSDICDMHSNVNFYGMGPGCYPKNKVPPFPAHPHCLCHLTQIFIRETPEPGEYDPKAGDKYLKAAPDHTRKAILGVRGEQTWQAGKIGWEKAARKRGWAGHMDIPGRIKPEDMKLKPPLPEGCVG
jgi:hypothetical protein